MRFSELALDVLVFLLAASAMDWLLALHFLCVFPAASSTDKMLNQNKTKILNFIPHLHRLGNKGLVGLAWCWQLSPAPVVLAAHSCLALLKLGRSVG